MQLQLANFIRDRLAANITAASTSIPLTAAAFPALAGGAVCYAILQSATDRSVVEIVKVTAAGATLTVERAQEGTTAKAFSANDIIEQRLTAGQFQSVVDHSNAASSHVPAGVAGKFLKGVAGGAPAWGMPTAAEVGALPIAGGVLTGTSPITLDTSLGTVTATSFAGALSGNAASAAKWATARTLSLTGHAVGSMSVDGSGNASAALTLAASGITAGTYKSVTFDIYGRATAGTNPTTLAGYGITDALALTGNAASAAKWATARTLSFTGHATGSMSVDGSGNASAALTLAASGIAAGTYKSVTFDIYGRATAGTNPTTLAGYGITDALLASGNAVSAAKWATARTLSFTGHAAGSMSVDGSGNASAALTLAASGIAAGTYKSVTFDIYGRATAGTNPTTLAGYGITDALALTGNAASAAKWATARTLSLTGGAVGSASVDGSAAVALAVTVPPTGHAHNLGTITDSPYKEAADVATTAALTVTATATTLTNSGTLAALAIDGVTCAVGMRVLVKDQTSAAQNGIYTVTAIGSSTVAWVLTRAVDADSAAEIAGAVTTVDQGTVNGAGLFTNDFKKTSVLGTTAMTWRSIIDAGNISTMHHASGIGAGTYRSVTVNAQGHVTAGTNPTTLAGYGITDALALTGNAASAAKWATARTLSFTGHAAGSMAVDGSGNASAALTLAASGVTAGTYCNVTVDAYGRVTGGDNTVPTQYSLVIYTPTIYGGDFTSPSLAPYKPVTSEVAINTTSTTLRFTGASYENGLYLLSYSTAAIASSPALYTAMVEYVSGKTCHCLSTHAISVSSDGYVRAGSGTLYIQAVKRLFVA